MRKFIETSFNERMEIEQKAKAWLQNHSNHVALISDLSENAVSPSGSDMFRPELWKGIHWNWFFATYNVARPQIPQKSFFKSLWQSLKS